MRNKGLYIGIVITGILITAFITRSSEVLLISIFFVAYLFSGFLRTPVSDEIKIKAKRNVERSLNEEFACADVSVLIVNEGHRDICFTARDFIDEDAKVISGSTRICTCLAPQKSAEIKYSLRVDRGGVQWKNIPLIVMDPFGCFLQEIFIEAEDEIFFQLQYKKFKSFQSYPWKTVSTPGIIPTRKSGNSGIDFFGIREYHSGDSVRKLDWKTTEKHPHKFFIREFEQESNTEIGIIVDGRKRMDLQIGNESIFETEINLAASLSEMFLSQGNRVGLSIAGDNSRTILPGYGKRQLHKILNYLSTSSTGNDGSNDEIHTIPIRQYSFKTQFFFISPYDYDDLRYYRELRSRGLQIVLISPDTMKFAFDEQELKNKNNYALRICCLERRINLNLISKLAIPVIDWDIKDPIQPILKNVLRNAGRMRGL